MNKVTFRPATLLKRDSNTGVFIFSINLVKQTIFLFWLPNLNINKHKMKQQESTKSLEILLDENLTWKEHLKNIENKFAKFKETLKRNAKQQPPSILI